MDGWLVGWLVSWLVGWLLGWLLGWLVVGWLWLLLWLVVGGCGCGCGCGCCCCWLLVVGCLWLFVVVCLLLLLLLLLLVVVVGCWLVGWLLVVGCWLLVVGCWLLVLLLLLLLLLWLLWLLVVVGCCCCWWWCCCCSCYVAFFCVLLRCRCESKVQKTVKRIGKLLLPSFLPRTFLPPENGKQFPKKNGKKLTKKIALPSKILEGKRIHSGSLHIRSVLLQRFHFDPFCFFVRCSSEAVRKAVRDITKTSGKRATTWCMNFGISDDPSEAWRYLCSPFLQHLLLPPRLS